MTTSCDNFILPVQFSSVQFSSVQCLSRVWHFATPWIAAHQASLSIAISRSSVKHVHRVGDAIQPSHPLSSPFPPSPNPSQHQGLFQWVNFSHEGGQNIGVSASASVLPMNIGLISFRMDWLDLLAAQGTLKSLLQHPQFKCISSSVLSFLYGPILTSIHDHWKSHSFDQMELCWQSNVSAF